MEGWLPDWLAGNEMWDLGTFPLAILGIQATATATIISTSIVVTVAPGIKVRVLALVYFFFFSSPSFSTSLLFMVLQMIIIKYGLLRKQSRSIL